MGWTMPLSRIDAASSSIRSGAIAARGWNGLGSRLSVGASRASRREASGSVSGRSADSPLPSAFLLMRHQLLRQLQIGLGPPRPDVVEKDRLAEARRFPELDVPRDRRAEDLLLEMLADLGHDLLGQVRPLVHH